MPRRKPLSVIGRTADVAFLDHAQTHVVAKVDTGADISSIWASNVVVDEATGTLHFNLFGPRSRHYIGTPISVEPADYHRSRFTNSFGGWERRYVVKLRVRVEGRLIRASFSLADRAAKAYPVLLGCRLLRSKFLVDVTRGHPIGRPKVTIHDEQLTASQEQT